MRALTSFFFMSALLVSPLALRSDEPKARRISGTVHQADSEPVPIHTEVDIDGGGSDLTTLTGKFSFPLPPLKVGFPYAFHVSGWVVIDPCVMARGRTYLPDPEAETISIRVLRPGDQNLLKGNSIGCVIQEGASDFQPRGNPGRPTARLRYDATEMSATAWPRYLSFGRRRSKNSAGAMMRVVLSARTKNNLPVSAIQTEMPASKIAWDEFLVKKAADLGFTVEELKTAIDNWIRSVQDPYSKGLAALYEFHYTDAVELIRKSLSSNGGDLPERNIALARAEYELGDYAAAEGTLRKVLAAHPNDPVALNNLATVLQAQAKYVEADPLLKRALTIDEETLGPQSRAVAKQLSNLAVLDMQRGMYPEAESLLDGALAIDSGHPGLDDAQLALILNNLSGLYYRQHRYEKSFEYIEQARAVADKALGPNNPALATILSSEGKFFLVAGRYDEARSLFQKALDISELTLGPSHPQVATMLLFLGSVYYEQDKYAEATPLYERALKITEASLGPKHPTVASALNNLAGVYSAQGDYAKAEPLLLRAKVIDEDSQNPELLQVLRNIAGLYNAESRDVEAESYYEKVVAMDDQTHADPVFVVEDLDNLAYVYETNGKPEKSVPVFERAIALGRNVLPRPELLKLAKVVDHLSQILYKLGRLEDSKTYAIMAAGIRATQ
jgi:tetratricopeptide (TPR) repeat protein